MRLSKYVSAALLVFALVLTTILPGMAASTTKSLSTNFTLVNLGTTAAHGVIQYFKPDGTAWKPNENFTIDTAGGQAIFRQYLDNALSAGQGSVVVSADQPVGAVVQILARNQVASSDAYVGIAQGSERQNLPLVMRRLNGASGLANSQIIVQNSGTSAVVATITLVNPDGTTRYAPTTPSLAAGASYTFDLDNVSAANVPDGWYGSAVVSVPAGNSIAVVSNLFTGPNGLMAFNAFAAAAPNWSAPLFVSRLGNGLSTPVTVQNLSGGPLAVGTVTLTCNKNAASGGVASFTRSNTAIINNTASWGVNPVNDLTLPDNWYGSCSVTSTGGNVVAFVQMRIIGTDRAAAYQAIRSDSTDKTAILPLMAKRLSNQFATVANVINLNAGADAHVKFTYIPSPEYVLAGGSATNIVINPVTIPAGGAIQQNLRVTSGNGSVPQLVDGWYGSLMIESSDQPINAIVELTMLVGDGDTYQAHNVFTKP